MDRLLGLLGRLSSLSGRSERTLSPDLCVSVKEGRGHLQTEAGERVVPCIPITLKHVHNLAILTPPFLIPCHSHTHPHTGARTPSEPLRHQQDPFSGDFSLSLSPHKPTCIASLPVAVPRPPPAVAPSCFFPPPPHGVSFMPTDSTLLSSTPLGSTRLCPANTPPPPWLQLLTDPATSELPGPAPPGLSAVVDLGATCFLAPMVLLHRLTTLS